MLVLNLHGAIDEYSATQIIDQMNWAVMDGEKEITLAINSEGGNVFKGFGIIDVMLQLQNQGIAVNTHIGGLAGSMAGVIAMFGDKVTMNDFAFLMIHNPSVPNGRPDPKTTEVLAKVRESLKSIFVKRRNMSEDEINMVMDAETWFGSGEAMEKGLIDEVIDTGVTFDNTIGAVFEIANQLEFNKETQVKFNIIKMKDICAKVGIEETDNVEDINNAIDTMIDNAVAEVKAENEALQTSIEEKNQVIEDLETEIVDFAKEKAELLVNSAVEEGKIKEDAKQSWIEKAVENYDDVKMLLGSINTQPVKITDVVDTNVNDEVKDDKTFDDYMNEGTAGKLQKENPELYAKLFEAKFGKKPIM